MMNTIAPVWDGNETWLVLGGGGLLAAFPLAYAVIMPALYPPIIAMLLAWCFAASPSSSARRTPLGRAAWDIAFCAAARLVAACCQGHCARRPAAGHPRRKIASTPAAGSTGSPSSPSLRHRHGDRLCAAGRDLADLETTGEPAAACAALCSTRGAGTVALIGIVSLWTPLLNPTFVQRWFAFPAIL